MGTNYFMVCAVYEPLFLSFVNLKTFQFYIANLYLYGGKNVKPPFLYFKQAENKVVRWVVSLLLVHSTSAQINVRKETGLKMRHCNKDFKKHCQPSFFPISISAGSVNQINRLRFLVELPHLTLRYPKTMILKVVSIKHKCDLKPNDNFNYIIQYIYWYI